MLNVIIKTIPHREQRYETCGDWWFERDTKTLHIRVSDLNSWCKEICIAVHELIEAMLCERRGISENSVTEFDVNYEAQRADGDDSEPGDSPLAPYRKEHFFATSVERLLAAELKVDWQLYERFINSL